MELQVIQNKIYEIRGQRVMLDFDLAEMYGIETKVLKRTVRRNVERFEGEDFMFELTKEELLRCQIGTLNKGRGTHFKYMPFAFTELGVAMLSSVLHSDIAIEVNRNIMRAFVAVRHILLNPTTDDMKVLRNDFEKFKLYFEEVLSDINEVDEDTRMQIELINESIAELQAKKKLFDAPRKRVKGYRTYDEE